MPIIIANILAGRDNVKKAALVRALTDATVQALDAPVESVRVIINEMPPEHYGIAGETVAELKAGRQSQSPRL